MGVLSRDGLDRFLFAPPSYYVRALLVVVALGSHVSSR